MFGTHHKARFLAMLVSCLVAVIVGLAGCAVSTQQQNKTVTPQPATTSSVPSAPAAATVVTQAQTGTKVFGSLQELILKAGADCKEVVPTDMGQHDCSMPVAILPYIKSHKHPAYIDKVVSIYYEVKPVCDALNPNPQDGPPINVTVKVHNKYKSYASYTEFGCWWGHSSLKEPGFNISVGLPDPGQTLTPSGCQGDICRSIAGGFFSTTPYPDTDQNGGQLLNTYRGWLSITRWSDTQAAYSEHLAGDTAMFRQVATVLGLPQS